MEKKIKWFGFGSSKLPVEAPTELYQSLDDRQKEVYARWKGLGDFPTSKIVMELEDRIYRLEQSLLGIREPNL